MTRTIGEGRAVVGAVERNGRVFRINTWFRFQDRFYGMGTDVAPIKKAVAGGLLGWPIKATVSASTGFDWKFYWVGKTSLPVEPVPPELDYDLWLGPAPWKPYSTHRVHGTFRGYWTTTGAASGTWGCTTSTPCSTSSARTTRARSRCGRTVRSSTPTPAAPGGASR